MPIRAEPVREDLNLWTTSAMSWRLRIRTSTDSGFFFGSEVGLVVAVVVDVTAVAAVAVVVVVAVVALGPH